MQVRYESLRGAPDIEKIHRVCPNTWELRRLVRARFAPLRPGYDFSDRSPAQAAGPESKCFVEAIVQLRPFFRCGKLRYRFLGTGRSRIAKKDRDILRARLKQPPGLYGFVDHRLQRLVPGRHCRQLFRHPCDMQGNASGPVRSLSISTTCRTPNGLVLVRPNKNGLLDADTTGLMLG